MRQPRIENASYRSELLFASTQVSAISAEHHLKTGSSLRDAGCCSERTKRRNVLADSCGKATTRRFRAVPQFLYPAKNRKVQLFLRKSCAEVQSRWVQLPRNCSRRNLTKL